MRAGSRLRLPEEGDQRSGCGWNWSPWPPAGSAPENPPGLQVPQPRPAALPWPSCVGLEPEPPGCHVWAGPSRGAGRAWGPRGHLPPQGPRSHRGRRRTVQTGSAPGDKRPLSSPSRSQRMWGHRGSPARGPGLTADVLGAGRKTGEPASSSGGQPGPGKPGGRSPCASRAARCAGVWAQPAPRGPCGRPAPKLSAAGGTAVGRPRPLNRPGHAATWPARHSFRRRGTGAGATPAHACSRRLPWGPSAVPTPARWVNPGRGAPRRSHTCDPLVPNVRPGRAARREPPGRASVG